MLFATQALVKALALQGKQTYYLQKVNVYHFLSKIFYLHISFLYSVALAVNCRTMLNNRDTDHFSFAVVFSGNHLVMDSAGVRQNIFSHLYLCYL